MPASDAIVSIQDQYLSLLKQAQGFALDAVRTAGTVTEPIVQNLPAIPFADKLPSAKDAVSANFDFVEKLVAAEREFAAEFVATFTGSAS